MNEFFISKIDFDFDPITSDYEKSIKEIEDSSDPAVWRMRCQEFLNRLEVYGIRFLHDDVAGDAIRKGMESIPGLDDTKMIESIDLNFAVFQYNEYLNGMRKYLSSINDTGTVSNASVKNKIDEIILKDRDFVSKLFTGTEINERKMMPIESAWNCVPLLVMDIKKLSESKGYELGFYNNYLDKLVAHTHMSRYYYGITYAMREIKRICEGSQKNSSNTDPQYAVF